MRKKRQTYFVCSAIIEHKLKNEVISAMSSKEAASLFYKQYNCYPQDTLGPFFKKRDFVEIHTNKIKFSQVSKKAEYNGWVVNAFILTEPKDHAYLIFIKNKNDTSENKPTNSVIVPLDKLRFENV